MPYSGFPPVLVVDDVPMIIEVVRAVLGQLGFRDIDTAADGTAALERLRQRRYGLVLSDWNMLPMTGYELLRRVRTDPALRETPFVMMTTQAQADCFPAARRAGVNACLIKPFAPSKLRETIIAVCGNVRPDGAPSRRGSAAPHEPHLNLHRLSAPKDPGSAPAQPERRWSSVAPSPGIVRPCRRRRVRARLFDLRVRIFCVQTIDRPMAACISASTRPSFSRSAT